MAVYNKICQKKHTLMQLASNLDERVYEVIKDIFDLKKIEMRVAEYGYDSKKLPLGKLSNNTISQANIILKKIDQELQGRSDNQSLKEFSQHFYSLIPHDFGFGQMGNFIINNKQKLVSKVHMLEALEGAKVAIQLASQEHSQQINLFDSYYLTLNTTLTRCSREQTLAMVHEYLKNSYIPIANTKLNLINLFQIKKQSQDKRYKKELHNKQLLWKWVNFENIVSMMYLGPRILPPEAPLATLSFGKGFYFTDQLLKSPHSFSVPNSNYAYLILCEVALGDSKEMTEPDAYANNLPPQKHSVCGRGRRVPQKMEEIDGVSVPLHPKIVNTSDTTFEYNTYVVYDVSQVRMRYLLRVCAQLASS